MSLTCQDSRANSDTPYFLPVQVEGFIANNNAQVESNIPVYITNGAFGIGNQEPLPNWNLEFRLRLEPSNSPSYPNLRQGQFLMVDTTQPVIENLTSMFFNTYENKESVSSIVFITDNVGSLTLSSNSCLATVPLIAGNNTNGTGGSSAQIVVQDNSFCNGILDFYNPSNTFRFCNSNNGNLYLFWGNSSNAYAPALGVVGNAGTPIVSIPTLYANNIQVAESINLPPVVEISQILDFTAPSNTYRFCNSNDGVLYIDYSNSNNSYTNMIKFIGNASGGPHTFISNLDSVNAYVSSNITIGSNASNRTVITDGIVTSTNFVSGTVGNQTIIDGGTISASNIEGGYTVTSRTDTGPGSFASYNNIQIGNMVQQWGSVVSAGGLQSNNIIVLPILYANTNYTIQLSPSVSTGNTLCNISWANKQSNGFTAVLTGTTSNLQAFDWFTCGYVAVAPSTPPGATFINVTNTNATAYITDSTQTGTQPITYILNYVPAAGGTVLTQEMIATGATDVYFCELSNLTPNTEYTTNVTASNATSTATSTPNTYFTTTTVSVPPQPTITNITSTSVTATVTDSAQTGNPPISYFLNYSYGGSLFSQAMSSNAPSTYSCVVSDLTPGREYINVNVTASNAVAIAYSTPNITFTTTIVPPSTPPPFFLGTQTPVGFDLRLTDPLQNGSVPLNYFAYWTPDGTTISSQALVYEGVGSYSFSNTTDFSTQTRYNITAVVSNAGGSATSTIFVGTTNATISKPDPPVASDITRTSVLLTWDVANITSSVGPFDTNVLVAPGGFPNIPAFTVDSNGTQRSATISNLTPNTLYAGEVIAFTSSPTYQTWSDMVLFTTLP